MKTPPAKLLFVLLVTAASTTQSNTLPEAATPQCPTAPRISFLDHHQDCNRFYLCSGDQVAVELQCPPQLYWNQQLRLCDKTCVRAVKESSEIDTKQLIPKQSPVVPVTTRPDDIRCPKYLAGARIRPTFFSHEQDCSKYYECVGGAVVEMYCPPLMFWNQDEKRCGYECIN